MEIRNFCILSIFAHREDFNYRKSVFNINIDYVDIY